MISNNAVLFSTLAACALAAPASSPNANSQPSGLTNLWKVPPMFNSSHSTQLAWTQVKSVKTTIDTASDDGRLFSYYPTTYNAGGQLYVLFSGAPKDIDGMGQDVRISLRTNNGYTKPEVAFPAALLPNQTTIETSEYYCKRGIPQRALQPLSVVYVAGGDGDGEPKFYAVAQSSDNICPGSFQSAGRVARLLNVDGGPDGTFSGGPCWIEINEYTGAHQWAETVYGTKYHMKVCEDKDAINAALAKPENVPAQATSLFNTPLIAADGKHNVSYPTQAVLISGDSSNGRYMRFWADVSVRNITGNAFVEYSDDGGKSWFPATTDGSNIQESTIYSSWKAWYGSSAGQEQLRVYISNSGMDASQSQNILTVATSRGSDLAFRNIGIVRGGDATATVPQGTRGMTNTDYLGFYWPSASFSGDELIVAYSESKAAIELSTIKLSDLP